LKVKVKEEKSGGLEEIAPGYSRKPKKIESPGVQRE